MDENKNRLTTHVWTMTHRIAAVALQVRTLTDERCEMITHPYMYEDMHVRQCKHSSHRTCTSYMYHSVNITLEIQGQLEFCMEWEWENPAGTVIRTRLITTVTAGMSRASYPGSGVALENRRRKLKSDVDGLLFLRDSRSNLTFYRSLNYNSSLVQKCMDV